MARIEIASWPGRGGDLNPFIDTFVTGLENKGCEVLNLQAFPFDEAFEGAAVVIHWPQFIFKNSFGKVAKVATILRLVIFLRRLKKRGVRILWLCHDLKPHDWNDWQWQALWWPTLRVMFLMSDGIIALSPKTETLIAKHYSRWIRGRLSWAWHPQYENVLVASAVREDMRASLGTSESVVLIGFFGQIRLQKGVEDLMHAFGQTDNDEMHLLIAGSPLASAVSVAEHAISESKRDSRVHAVIRKLDDDEFKNLVSACDICVFPYHEYTHSGAMIYSLSAHKRLLTPRTPFSESLADALPDWVELYEGELTPEKLLAATQRKMPDTPPDLSPFSATKMAEKVVELAGMKP